MRTIECPNCGAPATNLQNCNFCGSLLVRFADKGIDLSTTSYLSNEAVLPGLIRELEKNLELQQKEKEIVKTVLLKEDKTFDIGFDNFCTVYSSDQVSDTHGNLLLPNAKSPSLCLVMFFHIYDSELEAEYPTLKDGRIQKEKFEKLAAFPLFDVTCCRKQNSEGLDLMEYCYYVDFGSDPEGAARLISEIAIKVFNCNPDKPLTYFTGTNSRVQEFFDNLSGEVSSSNGNDVKKWIWIGIAIVGGLIYLLSL